MLQKPILEIVNLKKPSSSPPAAPEKTGVLVYACSGCSDAGELADRIARQLAREGAAEMSCLAGIGGRVKSLVTKAKSAKHILVIDGCPLACGRQTLEQAGFTKFERLDLQDLGFRKGSCSVDESRISVGVTAARKIILPLVNTINPHAAAQ
jgi:uncharacterized metal-binding protein